MTRGTRRGSPRVLMLPWLAHGHISPYLELAKKLADKNFHIYFCSTPINLTSITKKLTEKYSQSIQLVELHLPSLPHLPPHYHTTNGLPSHLMPTLKFAFESASPNFSIILKTLNPDSVLYDFNLSWAAEAASAQNIPAVLFLTFGVAFTSFALHRVENPGADFPFQSIFLHEHEKLNFQKMAEFSVNGVKDFDRWFECIRQSRGLVLIKTCRELEKKFIDFLSESINKRIQPAGTLVQEPLDEDGDSEIMEWLNKKETSSVVFVSFGTEFFLSKEEIEEIAHGLDLSEVNFIWAVRFPVGEKIKIEDALPEGFVQRIGERGKIVEGWAPQLKILQHSSVGGFVSHCGWSSVLESIKFRVPIIAMPMHLDQPLNTRLIEEVGVAVYVKRDNSGELDREEIARVIKKIVKEKNGVEVKSKIRELSEKIQAEEEEEVDEMAKELVLLCEKRN